MLLPPLVFLGCAEANTARLEEAIKGTRRQARPTSSFDFGCDQARWV